MNGQRQNRRRTAVVDAEGRQFESMLAAAQFHRTSAGHILHQVRERRKAP